MNEHLSADQLIDALYGVGSTAHLDQCAECRQRLESLLERRAEAVNLVEAPADALAAQRRAIYARMGEKPAVAWRWAPAWAAAAAVVVAAGVFSLRPQQTIAPQVDQSQFFSDVYSMQQSMEPLAAKPIDAIFDQEAK